MYTYTYPLWSRNRRSQTKEPVLPGDNRWITLGTKGTKWTKVDTLAFFMEVACLQQSCCMAMRPYFHYRLIWRESAMLGETVSMH